ncbi:MAG: type I-D CRISPR-associated protein Cas10d/Csc3, partial [Dolichospermum sp.]
IRIDQIAEFGDLITRKIWEETVEKIENARKKDKKLPEVPNFDLTHKVVEFWNLTEYLPQVREIQRINESLKEQKLKGNTGGVPYEWYYLAAKYLEKNPGIEDVRVNCQQVINYLTNLISPILTQYQLPDGWDDLRLWVSRVIMLPNTNKSTSVTNEIDNFINELNNYNAAKKPGRGKQLICSISHSA